MKTVAFVTLGCKVNQYETNEMQAMLQRCGYAPAGAGEEADVYIVNSCAVTGESGRKSRQAVRSLRQRHPQAVIVLTGCYPQAFPDEAAALDAADLVLGNKTNRELPARLETFFADRKKEAHVTPHLRTDLYSGAPIARMQGHTRAFVKIQDGCNRYCTYCIIPKSRGFSRSRPPEEIRAELAALAENGYKEIVFVGINLSAYGLDNGRTLADALRIAEETAGIERIRLGSLEPDHITDELIAALASMPKFCPQFHLSLQSGSDRTLKRMNRHYTAAEYKALAEKLKRSFPDLSLTTDVIVGFPGETAADFEASCRFVEDVGFMKVHVFPFSPREGTPAAGYPDQIENAEKAARAAALQAAAAKVRANWLETLTGSVQEVLFETPKAGFQRGYAKNYTPVAVETELLLSGQIRRVKITAARDDGCAGVLLDD